MKKLIFLLPLCFLLSNCSSDSSDGGSSAVNFKFTLDGYYDFVPVTETLDPFLYWDAEIENNGSTTYTISKQLKRAGSNPLFNQDVVNFQITINTVGPLVVNQVYPISVCGFDNELPFNDDNFEGCNVLYLGKTSTTTGQIKITALNGDNLSGTFSFGNLLNDDTASVVFGCTGQPTQQLFSISNGVFTNIPKF
jgi:hypothetical protein